MTSEITSEPIVVAIKLDDPALADRLTALLSDVPGLRLARANEPADVAIVASHGAEKAAQEVVQTPVLPRQLVRQGR